MSEYNGRCSNAKEKPVTKHYIFFYSTYMAVQNMQIHRERN